MHKVLENCQGLQSVMYDHLVKSTNLVTVHEDTVKNVLLTDVSYYLLIYSTQRVIAVLRCNPVLLSSGKVLLSLDFKSLSLKKVKVCHLYSASSELLHF